MNSKYNSTAAGKTRKRIWLAAAPAMILPFTASLFYFVWMSDTHFAASIYFGTKIFTLLWPALVWMLVLRRRIRPVWHGKTYWRALPLGIATGLAISGGLWALLQTPLAELLAEAAPAIRTKAEQMGFLEHYWIFAIFLSFIHSLIEEYYWRWFVYGRLREIAGLTIALPLASLAFGAHHIVVLSQYFPLGWAFMLGLMVAVGGAMWCLMLEYQRSIFGAWTSHIIVDLAVMWTGYLILFC